MIRFIKNVQKLGIVLITNIIHDIEHSKVYSKGTQTTRDARHNTAVSMQITQGCRDVLHSQEYSGTTNSQQDMLRAMTTL